MGSIGARELAILALVLLVLLVVWRISRTAQRSTTRPTVTPLDTSTIATIDGLVARGDKPAAIDTYRRQTGASLADSERAIDSWQPGGMAPGSQR